MHLMVAVVRVLSPLHPHVLLRKAYAKRGGPPRCHPPSQAVPGSVQTAIDVWAGK